MFEKLLSKIAQCLDNYNLPYMIIGGQAVLLYGEPRLTRDIDITLGIGVEEFPRMEALLERIGLGILVQDVEDFVRRTMVIPARDTRTGLRVDLTFSDSIYETEALGRAKRVLIGETHVKFISPEDLIIHKIIAGRARDIEDVKGILLKNPDLDLGYIKHWLSEFDKALAAVDAAKAKYAY